MNPFNVSIFSKPSYSSFPWKHGNRISMNAGKVHVIGWEYLDTGEKIEGDLGGVIRQAPMLAPTLDSYKCDVHGFAVRLRTIGQVSRDPWSYEDFFNLNVNTDGSKTLPMVSLGALIAVNRFRTGTLFEELGVPTYNVLRNRYLDYLKQQLSFVFDPVAKMLCIPFAMSGNYNPVDAICPASAPSYIPDIDPDLSYLSLKPEFDFISHGASNAYSGSYDNMFSIYLHHFSGSFGFGVGFPSTVMLPSVASLRNDPLDTTIKARNVPFGASCSLVKYVLDKYPSVYDYICTSWGVYDFNDPTYKRFLFPYGKCVSIPVNIISKVYDKSVNVLDILWELEKVDAVSVLKDFTDYLLDSFWSFIKVSHISDGFDDSLGTNLSLYNCTDISIGANVIRGLKNLYPDLPYYTVYDDANITDVSIPFYPFLAYRKLISDWYINTAITNPDDYFFEFIADTDTTSISDFAQPAYNNSDVRAALIELNDLFNRYWKNDYFTSAFPTPQAGAAVGIPVNGTIVDLRNANAMQKLKERLLYAGTRFRDVLYSLTGKRTSAAIMDMSELIGKWSIDINVDSVLQQSESTKDSPQANYAGVGLGYRSGGANCVYVAEEPTVVFFVASIRPTASYFQGMPRKLIRSNVYDYDIPQLANIGEQKILRAELYADYNTLQAGLDPVFGYTRRNGDFMQCFDEVHGDFRNSLDFWHNARIFSAPPQLSNGFLSVRPKEDNLNRIFAVSSDSVDHFYCHFIFDMHIVRHLPKYIHYDL